MKGTPRVPLVVILCTLLLAAATMVTASRFGTQRLSEQDLDSFLPSDAFPGSRPVANSIGTMLYYNLMAMDSKDHPTRVYSRNRATIHLIAKQDTTSDVSELLVPGFKVASWRSAWLPLRYENVPPDMTAYIVEIGKTQQEAWPKQVVVSLSGKSYSATVTAVRRKYMARNFTYSNQWARHGPRVTSEQSPVTVSAPRSQFRCVGLAIPSRNGQSVRQVSFDLRPLAREVLYRKGQISLLGAAWLRRDFTSPPHCTLTYEDGRTATFEVFTPTPPDGVIVKDISERPKR